MRVIDCSTQQVVPLQCDQEYFALCYVWGEGAPGLGSSSGDMSLHISDAPPVIKDAMTAAKELGGRYLWVDRYCIDQSDAEDMHNQISNMDQMYEGACATLVAAGHRQASAGLPGVGEVSRAHQPRAISGGTALVPTLAPLSESLENAPWINRGWTYQEALLSRRCFFFTDSQVYFSYRRMTCCKGIDSPLDHVPEKKRRIFMVMNSFMSDPDHKTLSWAF